MISSYSRSFLRRTLLDKKTVIQKSYQRDRDYKVFYNSKTGIPFGHGQSWIHTSQRKNAAPLIVLLIKSGGIKIAKGLSIVFGRSFRKLYDRLPETMRNRVGRHKIIFSAGGILVPFVGYYTYTHYEVCPITGRKRWITFTKEQLAVLAELEYNEIMKKHEGKLLGQSHELYKKNIEIVSALVHGNSDINTVNQMNWTLHVIDDPTVTNAFVLPNGHIFVFTGMLKMLNSWQEMAVILGHEMSHAILGHSQEQQSYLAFGEILTVPLLAFIWFFFDDFAAFLVYTIQSYIYPLVFEYGFSLPYSRQLESEADEVGLILSSKACFDPRWSVLLWEKMAFQQAISDDVDSDEFEFLSTHPGNQKRSMTLERLLPQMMEIRKQCNCPDLPRDIDPQAAAQNMRRCVTNIKERKELLAELQEQKSLLGSKHESNPENDDGPDANTIQKAKLKIAEIQLHLTELEDEYLTLIGTPKSKPGAASEAIDKEIGFFKQMWEKISGKIAVSGKLSGTGTLFDNEKGKVPQLQTVLKPHESRL